MFFIVDRILTSTVVSDVRLGAQATFLRVADRVSRTVAVNLASNYTDAFDVRIRIWNGTFWTGTRIRAVVIGARGAVATSIRPCTFVYVC